MLVTRGTSASGAFILVLTLSVGACQFKKDSADDSSPTQQTEKNPSTVEQVVEALSNQEDQDRKNATLVDSDIQIQFTEHERFRYVASFTIPNRIPVAEVLYSTAMGKSVLRGGETFSVVMLSDAPILVEIETKDSKGRKVSDLTVQAHSPKDVEIRDVVLSKNLNVEANRIYLQGQITTNGKSMVLKARKIYSDSAWVRTFDSNSPQPDPRNYVGSSIILQAEKLFGSLDVNLLGLDGRPGRSGDEFEVRAGTRSPLNGTPGQAGLSEPREQCTRGRGPDAAPVCRTYFVCTRQPTSGTAGAHAPRAESGEDGSNGGHTGNLSIITEDLSEAKITIHTRPGRGGQGGAPAAVRPAGKGGAAGAMDPHGVCTPAQAGADGRPGIPGRAGQNGKNGERGTLILPEHLPGFHANVSVKHLEP